MSSFFPSANGLLGSARKGGVIHIATSAADDINVLWDLFAKSRKNVPLWKLVVDFTPEELVSATAFRYHR
ncbi:hypothetical protein EW145_g7520 [Phellinidium pouzarii]|uniref:Uncharacterized protein n=1 Tax=Phellinidium pouzarii TaxID=167371 RepID=A0A4S4KHX7_9AGAM|nr:hypothetical protein EW145_g7520 [Phellinidium pouzarii]